MIRKGHILSPTTVYNHHTLVHQGIKYKDDCNSKCDFIHTFLIVSFAVNAENFIVKLIFFLKTNSGKHSEANTSGSIIIHETPSLFQNINGSVRLFLIINITSGYKVEIINKYSSTVFESAGNFIQRQGEKQMLGRV